MKPQRARDFLLIAAILAIAVAAMWPEAKKDGESTRDDVAADVASVNAPAHVRTAPRREEGGAPGIPAAAGTSFPIVEGARWVYHVEGPEELVPADEWTLEIRALPEGDEPGEVAAGFGLERAHFPIWKIDGAVRFAGLPFSAPLEFRGTRPESIEGKLAPPWRSLVEGASWSQILSIDVEHEMTSPKGVPEKIAARGIETDRAIAGELAEIAVPAGRFTARRVDWTGHLELLRGKRPVLDPLTAKAYRSEVMWLAEGIGVVRRRVEHALPSKAVIVFDLVSTTLIPPRDGA